MNPEQHLSRNHDGDILSVVGDSTAVVAKHGTLAWTVIESLRAKVKELEVNTLSLKRQISAVGSERDSYLMECGSLLNRLAASQAREENLRAALEREAEYQMNYYKEVAPWIAGALATNKRDTTALDAYVKSAVREREAKVLEEAAKWFKSAHELAYDRAAIEDELRRMAQEKREVR